jgi:hypothetical protein
MKRELLRTEIRRENKMSDFSSLSPFPLSNALSLFPSHLNKKRKEKTMSSPPAAEDAPVRSERPKLNLKPRDEGAAAKLATERAAAAKSVSVFFIDECPPHSSRRGASGKKPIRP